MISYQLHEHEKQRLDRAFYFNRTVKQTLEITSIILFSGTGIIKMRRAFKEINKYRKQKKHFLDCLGNNLNSLPNINKLVKQKNQQIFLLNTALPQFPQNYFSNVNAQQIQAKSFKHFYKQTKIQKISAHIYNSKTPLNIKINLFSNLISEQLALRYLKKLENKKYQSLYFIGHLEYTQEGAFTHFNSVILGISSIQIETFYQRMIYDAIIRGFLFFLFFGIGFGGIFTYSETMKLKSRQFLSYISKHM